MEKNQAKYLSYAEAWRRITAAKEGKHYLEVVTICESTISDRLLSYVLGVDPGNNANIFTPFNALIKKWETLANGKVDPYIVKAVDEWRKERNAIIHGLVKSMPGTKTEVVSSFLENAERASDSGIELAKTVSKWHKQQLMSHLDSMQSKSEQMITKHPGHR